MTAKTHDVPTSFRRRAGAYAIDSALIFVIWLAAVMLSEIPDTTDDPEPWSTIAATVVVSLPALWFVYQWTCNATGVTIGKKFLSLRIRSTVARPRPEFSLSTDQRRPGVGDGFVRTIGQAVGLLPLGLKYLWSLWDAHDQTWHDELSSTLVVRILESPAGVSIENESMYGSPVETHLAKLRFRTRPWPRSVKGHLLAFFVGMLLAALSLLPEGVPLSSVLIASPPFGLGARMFTVAIGKFLNYVELRPDCVYLRDPENRTKVPYKDIEVIDTDQPNVLLGDKSGAVAIGYLTKGLLRRPARKGVRFELNDVRTFVTELRSRVQAVKGEPLHSTPIRFV